MRIRVKVRIPQNFASGGSGVVVRDSLGGETLQFATNEATRGWREVVLYRRIPEDGEITVTLGLAGLGEAYFDDLKIEVLENSSDDAPSSERLPLARQPRAPAATPPISDDDFATRRR